MFYLESVLLLFKFIVYKLAIFSLRNAFCFLLLYVYWYGNLSSGLSLLALVGIASRPIILSTKTYPIFTWEECFLSDFGMDDLLLGT